MSHGKQAVLGDVEDAVHPGTHHPKLSPELMLFVPFGTLST